MAVAHVAVAMLRVSQCRNIYSVRSVRLTTKLILATMGARRIVNTRSALSREGKRARGVEMEIKGGCLCGAVLAANHAQIVDVWDSLEALDRHLAKHHSVDF